MSWFPNLFIVGAHKAGTTSLYEHLKRHPEVFMSPLKEPGFFNAYKTGTPDKEAEAEYRDLFDGAEASPVRGEATVSYLHNPGVEKGILERAPDARIVISLRDPIQRTYSDYWRKVAAGEEHDPFDEAMEREIRAHEEGTERLGYLDRSLYASNLQRYLETFGEDRVFVSLLPEMKNDPEGTLEDLFSFLEIDPDVASTLDTTKRWNTFHGTPYGGLVERVRTSQRLKPIAQALLPKRIRDWLGNKVLLKDAPKPSMSDEEKKRLAAYFSPDLMEVQTLLGRDVTPLCATWPDAQRPFS